LKCDGTAKGIMANSTTVPISTVYGPVSSWRYGRSLGIDPIGVISTCSFNCVYCQLGEIEQITSDRQVYIPTAQIVEELKGFAPWDVDVITLSGSGEPTLAVNLGEILREIKQLTHRPTLVLTNATLLHDPTVRSQLAFADRVSVKLDAVSPEGLRRVNRPDSQVNFSQLWAGIEQFCAEYPGDLGIQTMILSAWDEQAKAEYIRQIKAMKPTEVQLNIPSRPKPVKRQLDGRGNHSASEDRPYEVRQFKCVSPAVLQALAQEIQTQTGVRVRTVHSN
jgi:wyosine [tRNA(Phe)-imidazoG37] synthetase (radical SAM superfamily)